MSTGRNCSVAVGRCRRLPGATVVPPYVTVVEVLLGQVGHILPSPRTNKVAVVFITNENSSYRLIESVLFTENMLVFPR